MRNREALVVSVDRTPIGKAYRGAFNESQLQTLGGHAIAHAIVHAVVQPAEIDVVVGCPMQRGPTPANIARQAVLRAGLSTSVADMSINRQCASGLMVRADKR
jgi:acetyl-CoA C-acetyltransferase